MKEIQLTQGKVALVDDEDYERVMERPWFAIKPSERHGWYASANFPSSKLKSGRRSIQMQRFILDATWGETVDHINGNGLDNRRANLRFCSQADNVKNAKKHRKSVSRFKGVTPNRGGNKNPWRAQIQCDKKKMPLGVFPTEADAAMAYNEAALKYFGEFARLNEAEQWEFNYLFEGVIAA